MANQLSLSLYEELIGNFEDVAGSATSSEVVLEARERGLKSFKNSGFPTRRNEEWKYTNITPYLQDKYIINGGTMAAAQDELVAKAQIPHLDTYQLVLVNGQPHTSENIGLPSFIKVQPIAEAQKNDGFASYFSKGTDFFLFFLQQI